jgi:hypothetical protein
VVHAGLEAQRDGQLIPALEAAARDAGAATERADEAEAALAEAQAALGEAAAQLEAATHVVEAAQVGRVPAGVGNACRTRTHLWRTG